MSANGLRRATLRGWENLNKRFKLAAAFYNLSQLMRKLFGFGTPKQLAALAGAHFNLLTYLESLTAAIATILSQQMRSGISRAPDDDLRLLTLGELEIVGCSTGC